MTDPAILASPLKIGDVTVANRVFLAPMSGVSDLPFRARAIAHGAGMVVSEMIASSELAKGRRQSALRLRRPDVPIHVVQLAGRDAKWMAEGARIAAGEGADIVDINMGCPAKKVTGGYCGSALMREPERALALIEAVVGAVKAPVTVKMRLGWDETALNAPMIARQAEDAGASMITVHGRTRCQFYKGKADWRAIARVKHAVSVPVVANGDIEGCAETGAVLAASGADAVMVGRGHYGAPWLAGQIAAQAGGSRAPGIPETGDELAAYIVGHYEDMLSLYGREQGVRHARKHLGWYMDRFAPGLAAQKRRAVLTQADAGEVIAALKRILEAGRDACRFGRAA